MIALERNHLSGLDATIGREWLVTNGLGGFASGTISGANTRRYHGLLFAALRPPLDRVLLAAKLEPRATYRGHTFELATNEFADGTIAPRGFELIQAFRLDGTIPVWTFAFDDVVLEQRIWMSHGQNTTYVQFSVVRAAEPITLTLTPLCTYRDYHWHSRGQRTMSVREIGSGIEVHAGDGTRPLRILSNRGTSRLAPDWYWNFKHRAESERGLDDVEDLFRPAEFTLTLAANERAALTLTAENHEPMPAEMSLVREQYRQQELLRTWRGADHDRRQGASNDMSRFIAHLPQLVLAADQFIVERHVGMGRPVGATVIAGYPWFSDWGRDTMISLPGLTLSTGRYDLAASILRTFARFVSEGMLPNRFPDAGDAPEYNTVDATLWYFVAIDEYLRRREDPDLLRELYPILKSIIDWHRDGTRYGIRVDQGDGLLHAGIPGAQLTWMDAKIGEWVVTPRIGKPVEINALWFNALEIMKSFARTLRDTTAAADFAAAADRVKASFTRRFWSDAGYLFDVIDGPDGNDARLRPNQLFAISLRHPLVEGEQAAAILSACERQLFTPIGMRSLSCTHPDYTGRYGGAPHERDAVYHQGTAWSWLLGAFARAHYRVHQDATRAFELLDGIAMHLREGCVGQVTEISDGDAPFTPRGCFAQAWGVAEILYAWSEINANEVSNEARRERRGCEAQR